MLSIDPSVSHHLHKKLWFLIGNTVIGPKFMIQLLKKRDPRNPAHRPRPSRVSVNKGIIINARAALLGTGK